VVIRKKRGVKRAVIVSLSGRFKCIRSARLTLDISDALMSDSPFLSDASTKAFGEAEKSAKEKIMNNKIVRPLLGA